MSTNRSRRIDRDTAEQLLGSASGGTTGGHRALAGLLAAVAAPAACGELPGEQAALAAFRVARPAPVHPSRRRSMLPSALAKVLSAKVAAAALASALGGVAVAAGTGNLPAALGGDDSRDAPVPTVTSPVSPSGAGSPSSQAFADPSQAVPPDLAELCRAFVAAPGTTSEVAPPDQRFAVLVSAAGSPAAVAGYCAPVLKDREANPTGPATSQPTDGRTTVAPPPPGRREASSRPSEPGATRAADPTNRPTSHPTPAPSPAGKGEPSGRPPG